MLAKSIMVAIAVAQASSKKKKTVIEELTFIRPLSKLCQGRRANMVGPTVQVSV